jgi:hypothetical protein
METTIYTGELAPKPRIEERILTSLGYEAHLDAQVIRPDGSLAQDAAGQPVTARNFLDAYAKPESRQHTVDMLEGFLDMEHTDPDYNGSREMIDMYMRALLVMPDAVSGS